MSTELAFRRALPFIVMLIIALGAFFAYKIAVYDASHGVDDCVHWEPGYHGRQCMCFKHEPCAQEAP